jgi:hypothetical protein
MLRFMFLFPLFACCSLAFLSQHQQHHHHQPRRRVKNRHHHDAPPTNTNANRRLAASLSGDEDLPIPNDDTQSNKALQQELSCRAEKLQVEKARDSLEHQNTQSFLKRKPVKLPYEIARKWVQLNLGVDTQAEFDDAVANGKLRTPYIPYRPEEYYTGTRDWISWEHFLTGYHKDQHPSAIRPSDGIFD